MLDHQICSDKTQMMRCIHVVSNEQTQKKT